MSRRFTGLKHRLITPEANELFSFPSLNTVAVDEVPVTGGRETHEEVKAWMQAHGITFVKKGEPWTGGDQVRRELRSGQVVYDFVDPQHAMLFKLSFGGK